MTIFKRILEAQERLGKAHEDAQSPEEKESFRLAIDALWFIWTNGQTDEFADYRKDAEADAPARVIAAFNTREEAEAWLSANPKPPNSAYVLIADEYHLVMCSRERGIRALAPHPTLELHLEELMRGGLPRRWRHSTREKRRKPGSPARPSRQGRPSSRLGASTTGGVLPEHQLPRPLPLLRGQGTLKGRGCGSSGSGLSWSNTHAEYQRMRVKPVRPERRFAYLAYALFSGLPLSCCLKPSAGIPIVAPSFRHAPAPWDGAPPRRLKMKKDTTKKPFFARLLEEQELEQVTGGVANKTQKYPSDEDEVEASLIKSPPDTTMKYPSDGDDDTAV
ncbi:microviridin/marinostatin family tricyclic proteinase inhibitor [Cystobacter fuscus]